MNILILGGGGREHAIAVKLSLSPKVKNIFLSPGNGGTAETFQNVALSLKPPFSEIVSFANDNQIGLIVIGPEDPLVDGAADALEDAGFKVFGPRKAGALLEGSKKFAKEIMQAAGVPTAAYAVFTDEESAKKYLAANPGPAVLKADGLAAGKGVIVCKSSEEALANLGAYFSQNKFGAAGNVLVIESLLTGQEASILLFCDGKTVRALPPSQDHKRIFDNDQGPNTGGMGVYTPLWFFKEKHLDDVIKRVALPTLAELQKRGITYKGILYAGLMIDGDEMNVVEFNARFGDPETECVLPLLKSDLAEVMLACAEGRLADVPFEIENKASCTVILASGGYPDAYEKNKTITGIDTVKNSTVYHAGTVLKNGQTLTSGGRVLAVTATDVSLPKAIETAYADVSKITFENMFYRKDIGKKGLN